MKKLILLLCFCVLSNLLFSQQARFEAFLKMTDDSAKADSLTNLGLDLEFVDNGLSLKYQQEALKVAQKIGDAKRAARVLYRVANTEKLLEQYNDALKHFQEAYTLFEAQKNDAMVMRTTQKLGQVYEMMKDYEQTLAYYQKAYAMAEKDKNKNQEFMGHTLGSIAVIYSQKKDFNEAKKYYEKAIILFKKINNEEGLAFAEFNFSGVCADLKLYNKALPMLERSAAFFNKRKQAYLTGMCLMKRGEIYYKMKQYDKAIENAQKSIDLLENEKGQLFTVMEGYEDLRKSYEATQNFPLAYQALMKWRTLNDSLVAQNNRATFATLQTKFETAQKESQIKALDQETKNQRNQLLWAIVGLSVLGALLGLSVYLYQNLRKNKRKVEEQAQQLSTLMKELHHRVKNNLAIISSLLNMQSNRMEDKNAAKAVKEGQMRVQAMSLIHQKLYKTDNVSTVNIETYLQELAESLMQAYGYTNDTFDLEIKTENPEVDIDTAIPIGLIVNELITNAMKYAYEGISRPLLQIYFKNAQQMTLQVKDNGVGFDTSIVGKSSNSFGTRLIKGLSSQLKGTFLYKNEGGTMFELVIPKAA